MNHRKIETLIKLLKENQVASLKTLEIEIKFQENSNQAFVSVPRETKPGGAAPATGAAIPPVDTNIPHHTNEVAKLLKLSDNDLVDALFPEVPSGGLDANS